MTKSLIIHVCSHFNNIIIAKYEVSTTFTQNNGVLQFCLAGNLDHHGLSVSTSITVTVTITMIMDAHFLFGYFGCIVEKRKEYKIKPFCILYRKYRLI